MYKLHTTCRACGTGNPVLKTLKQSTAAGTVYDLAASLVPVFDLGPMPLANDFCGPDDERAGYAPLKVMLCPNCGLAQLSVVVSPQVLYRNYPYVTSNSATMRKHFADIRYDIGEEAGDFKGVLEIGSNDGTLMLFLQEHGAKCIGIDPATNLTEIANKRGAYSLGTMFDAYSADLIVTTHGKPDVIIGRHVFAHVDNWKSFVRCLELVSAAHTLICLEVPYVIDQLDSVSWDQVYHEHLSYVSVRAVDSLLHGTALRLHKVKHYGIHGGSIMLMLRHRESEEPVNESVAKFIEQENASADRWAAFSIEARRRIDQLASFIRARATEGKMVVGYGASAKSTQWLNACKLHKSEVRFVCDNTPQKQYKTCPGSEIPVADEGALTRELPDYAVCFAWNFAEEIIAKEKIFHDKGGKWVIPVPQIKVL